MACACSCYSRHSDWLILRPVMPAGRLRVCKHKAKKQQQQQQQQPNKHTTFATDQTKHIRCEVLTSTLAGCT